MAEDTGGAAAAPAPLSLIYLDADDEITSAAARIRGAGADDVALVLPFGSRLATSRINFRLLAREAADRGKRIEIICGDASARALAIAAGLPTHASVAAFEAARSGAGAAADEEAEGKAHGNGTEAAAATSAPADATGKPRGAKATQLPLDLDDTQTHVLATPRRKPDRIPVVGPARPPVRTGLAIGVALALIVALIAGGYLALELLPSATITLHPRSEAVGPIQLSVEAREDVATPDPAAMTIPARRFTFPLQATQTFPATGVRIEEVKARGNVTFSNFDTGGANRIEAGSVVSTDSGIEFVTLATVTLPNATIQFPFTIVPSTSTVEVEAVVPGPTGNVGNNTIVRLPKGENKRLLQVTNTEATSGGARNESPEVSATDVESAKLALTTALLAALDQQVAAGAGVPDGVTLFPTTRVAGEPEWSVDPDSLVGTDGPEFSLGATAEGSALGVDPGPIEALAAAAIAGRVDEGWSIADRSVATKIGSPAIVGDSIVYPVTAQATQVHDVDQAALLAEVKGLTLPAARARLDDFGDVAIEVWPDWVTTMPKRDDRIIFELAAPQPSAPPS